MNEIVFDLMAFFNGLYIPGKLAIALILMAAAFAFLFLPIVDKMLNKIPFNVSTILIPVYLFGCLFLLFNWINTILEDKNNYQVGTCFQQNRAIERYFAERDYEKTLSKIQSLRSSLDMNSTLSAEAVANVSKELGEEEKKLIKIKDEIKRSGKITYVILQNSYLVSAYSAELDKVHTDFRLQSHYKVDCPVHLKNVIGNYEEKETIIYEN